ncbi:hypothetical protein tpqmel_0850, partial [Candidatus Gastranaerophilus sp. (ex Termes propinquus)]
MSSGKEPHKDIAKTEDKHGALSAESSVVPSSVFSNPIVNRQKNIAVQNSRTAANKLYGGYSNPTGKQGAINYQDILKHMNEVFASSVDAAQLFYSVHNTLTSRMQTNFTALGLINEQSNCLNIKLIDKLGSSYSSRIALNADDNPIVKCCKDKTVQADVNTSCFNVSYLNST